MSISTKKVNGLRKRMELSPDISKGIFSPRYYSGIMDQT